MFQSQFYSGLMQYMENLIQDPIIPYFGFLLVFGDASLTTLVMDAIDSRHNGRIFGARISRNHSLGCCLGEFQEMCACFLCFQHQTQDQTNVRSCIYCTLG